MRANQHRQAVDAWRQSVQRVASDNAASHGLEYLSSFRRCELFQFRFETLDREPWSEDLFHDGREMSERDARAKIILAVFGDEEVRAQVEVGERRLNLGPGQDRLRRQPFRQHWVIDDTGGLLGTFGIFARGLCRRRRKLWRRGAR